jgi:hypothetical protein
MSRQLILAVGAVGVILAGLAAPQAAAAPFTNGSFELGAFDDAVANSHVMSLPISSTLISGWTVIGGETAWARNDNGFIPNSATNGNFLLDLTGFHDSAPYGGVTQTVDTIAGSFYTLSFDLITQESDGRYKGPITVQASAGAVTAPITFTPLVGSVGVQSGRFSLPFIAAGTSTTISLQGTFDAGGQFIGLDNVTLTPEPGSLGLTLIGGAGLLLRRRRR